MTADELYRKILKANETKIGSMINDLIAGLYEKLEQDALWTITIKLIRCLLIINYNIMMHGVPLFFPWSRKKQDVEMYLRNAEWNGCGSCLWNETSITIVPCRQGH